MIKIKYSMYLTMGASDRFLSDICTNKWQEFLVCSNFTKEP